MQRVIEIDKNKKALMPCHPARAKELLDAGKAAVYRRFPFTIILKEREGGDTQPVALKIDSGSKTTGLALVADFQSGKRVIWGAELTHRGPAIRKDLPLEIEHITPKTRGGSNRVTNLSLACHECNQKKGTQTAAEFGHPDVQAKAKQPLKDAAAVNATRWALFNRLKLTGLPVDVATGGRTKFNRFGQGYPKAHWIDAAYVGESGGAVKLSATHSPLLIKATGRQRRQMTLPDKHGFPRTTAKISSRAYDFKTGDLVKAIVPAGKHAATHVGRVAIHNRPSFGLNGFDVHPKRLKTLHHSDGYSY